MTSYNVPKHVPEHLVLDIDYYRPGEEDDVFAAWHALSKRHRAGSDEPPPLFYSPRNGGHWVVATSEALEELFIDDQNLSNRSVTIPAREGVRFLPGEADGEHHTALRGAIMRAFTPRFVRNLRKPIEDIVGELVTKIQPRGECEFISEFSSIIPIGLFLGMMDLPLEDGPMLQELIHTAFQGLTADEKQQAFARMEDYLHGYVVDRYRNPRGDLISQMSAPDERGIRLTEADVHGVSINLLIAGLDTVAAMLGFIMMHLAERPDLRKAFVDDPKQVDRSLNELLRRFPIAVAGRVAARDFTYKGIFLKEGDAVALPTQLHGMDDRKYSKPMVTDPARRITQNMTFGRGRHLCAGNMIAREELLIAIKGWLRYVPDYRIKENANIVISGGTVTSMSHLPLEWDV